MFGDNEHKDLERKLRDGRPAPSSNLVENLADRVRSSRRRPAASGRRLGLAVAATTLALAAFASVGGISLAANAANDVASSLRSAAKGVSASHVVVKNSEVSPQYPSELCVDGALQPVSSYQEYLDLIAAGATPPVDGQCPPPAAPKPRLHITIKPNHKHVKAGHKIVFTVRVHNIGTGTANHLVVCATLPKGTVYKSSTPKGTVKNGRVCWKLSALTKSNAAVAALVAHGQFKATFTVKTNKNQGIRGGNTKITRSTATAAAANAKAVKAAATVGIGQPTVKGVSSSPTGVR